MRAPGEAAEPVSVQTALPTASAIVEAQPSGDPVPVAVDDDIERLLIKASPAARRVARENGVDLSVVTGTGPRGRIVTDDVLRAVAVVDVLAQAAKPSIAPAPEAPAPVWAASAAVAVAGCGVRERRPLGSVRRVIGERMLHSQQSAPHFSVAMDVDMGRVKEARDAWASFGEDTVPSYNDFVLWACAQALRAMPELNASADGGDVVVYSDINVGMAVAAPDGLIVPVIRSAERMSVRGVAARSRDMAKRAHDRKLLPADCEGGTFTVSNLGMFGVDRFVAIINPPQAAILAVGRVAPRVVTDGRSISIRTEATLTLSVDHRIADGIVASRFLGLVKQALETFLPN
jgi:pyruvate dehydrogenase E2 component (dihydrolipoamide acetyltransferase)